MALLTPEQMVDALVRLEGDLLHLETVVSSMASNLAGFIAAEGESHARINAALQNLAERQLVTEASLETLADRQAVTDAALNRLVEHIERFIQGQGGNGRGPSG